MIFKGKKWRVCRSVVMLPEDYYDGDDKHDSNYIRFGRCVPLGKPIPKNAIKTRYKWQDESKTSVYAIPIKSTGYSLTNKMYGKREIHDGLKYVRAYLALNGKCYTAKWELKSQV